MQCWYVLIFLKLFTIESDGLFCLKAGLKVGDMLLAVNKDVCLESNYDEVNFSKYAHDLFGGCLL